MVVCRRGCCGGCLRTPSSRENDGLRVVGVSRFASDPRPRLRSLSNIDTSLTGGDEGWVSEGGTGTAYAIIMQARIERVSRGRRLSS